MISECLDKHFAYKNKKAFPKYRFQQILNAISHAPLSEVQSEELKKRVSQLRDIRKGLAPNVVQAIPSTPKSTKPAITDNRVAENEDQLYESLYSRIESLKQILKSTLIINPAQKREIEDLHKQIIYHTNFSNKRQAQITKSILELQSIVNSIEKPKRCKHIYDLIEELKHTTIEDGFEEKLRSLRTKIKTDKSLLFEDVKELRHIVDMIKPNVPLINLSNISQQESTQKVVEERVIPWAQIGFGNNVLYIKDECGKILLSRQENCRKSYNQIKEYLADKLPQIVIVKNQSGLWTLKEPVAFKEALLMIRRKETKDLIQEERYKRALRSFASMDEYLKNKENQEYVLKRLNEKKQDFIKYLIKSQLKDYKLIPAIEMIAHESSDSIDEEDVFIFTVPSKSYRFGMDCVNIVYENINIARASIVCTVEKNHYTQALQSLFNFMNDENQKNKRSRLHQTLRLSNAVRNLHVVNHTDMHSWAMSIQH